VEIVEATHENFGLSLKACVSSWLFTPEQAASRPERDYTHEFTPEKVPGGMDRLARLLREGETISSSGANLSGKPTRVSSTGLCFPQDMLSQPNDGKATIEFIIDKCGLAQLPRIVEASTPSFGWAAANWVGSMRFKPLLREGAPIDLRVVVPITFKHPAPAASSANTAAGAPGADKPAGS
jgi:TonB family protein